MKNCFFNIMYPIKIFRYIQTNAWETPIVDMDFALTTMLNHTLNADAIVLLAGTVLDAWRNRPSKSLYLNQRTTTCKPQSSPTSLCIGVYWVTLRKLKWYSNLKAEIGSLLDGALKVIMAVFVCSECLFFYLQIILQAWPPTANNSPSFVQK